MKHSYLRIFSLLSLISALALAAAPESELKDASAKTIIKYGRRGARGDRARRRKRPRETLGLILCFPEHDRPVGDEIYPVRESLKRLGLSDQYVLLAGGPQERKFGPADHEPLEKLIAWAIKTYPINPRRIHMYGKGEGGKISGEFRDVASATGDVGHDVQLGLVENAFRIEGGD
jgi:hypothetical protein